MKHLMNRSQQPGEKKAPNKNKSACLSQPCPLLCVKPKPILSNPGFMTVSTGLATVLLPRKFHQYESLTPLVQMLYDVKSLIATSRRKKYHSIQIYKFKKSSTDQPRTSSSHRTFCGEKSLRKSLMLDEINESVMNPKSEKRTLILNSGALRTILCNLKLLKSPQTINKAPSFPWMAPETSSQFLNLRTTYYNWLHKIVSCSLDYTNESSVDFLKLAISIKYMLQNQRL
ncbi:hypothetical protein VP01_140g4 [Puccinia sorghi]|uniref:Uncharacterized protein n=1 Tax=Puccinia sorghi TaxID=27349 RepID=A0A0L6VKU1_9BASI|nr:hypothetical protein VP01_140g4 [Puccinia sorghi]